MHIKYLLELEAHEINALNKLLHSFNFINLQSDAMDDVTASEIKHKIYKTVTDTNNTVRTNKPDAHLL